MRSLQLAAISALALSVTLPANAFAWGIEGHAIVANIAEARLTPAAKAQVAALLALEQHSRLDEISSWADDIRNRRPETAPWHYVDIPLDASSYDAARDCPGNACVVGKIIDFTAVLAGATTATPDRLEALKWLVHFVGDIHQPLHCEDDGDKGGNAVKVKYFNRSSGENLHHVWDSDILEHGLSLTKTSSPSELDKLRSAASTLNGNITATQAKAWAPAGLVQNDQVAVVDWANASHQLAHDVAYADLPTTPTQGGTEALGAAYQDQAWPVVKEQLERGGVRLAELLNETLK